ncbi:hypothetical protein IQ07DRAFT_404814 [Pyrenochaeta sp. DS3sAY3a]|nr:hypothetical protein IQ07DRAFT_404814 [Pyrenochaeta sp. DS3sAY3a]
MCIRVVEKFPVCGCVYHTHAVDRCSYYGRHSVVDKIVWGPRNTALPLRGTIRTSSPVTFGNNCQELENNEGHLVLLDNDGATEASQHQAHVLAASNLQQGRLAEYATLRYIPIHVVDDQAPHLHHR